MTSTSSSLRALRTVLETLAPAGDWKQETRQSDQLSQLIEANLPSPLAAACRAWLEDDGVLVIACASGAVAAKLKQVLPRLLQIFRKAEGQIRSIRVEVQAAPASLTVAKKSAMLVPPPASVASDLEQAADRMQAPGLAQAMRRLAAHLRERAGPDDRREG